MRISKNSILRRGTLLSALLLCAAVPSLAVPNDKIEPPAEYTLQVNGSNIPLTLGNEVTSTVGGQKVRLKLSRRPFRQFKKSGVQFDYPVGYSFEVDDSEPEVTVWTLSQGDSTLIFNRFDKLPLTELSDSIVEGITQEFGAKNVRVSPVTLSLNGKSRSGKRLTAVLAGQQLVQDVFAFSTAKNSFVIVLQDVPENGKPSPESTKLKAVLTQSLKW